MAVKKASKPVQMTDVKNFQVLNLGDVVVIRYSGGQRGRIMEFRGPLGPKGANIYRVRVGRKPKPKYIELREDQLERVPTVS